MRSNGFKILIRIFLTWKKPGAERMNSLAVATFFGGCAAMFLIDLIEKMQQEGVKSNHSFRIWRK